MRMNQRWQAVAVSIMLFLTAWTVMGDDTQRPDDAAAKALDRARITYETAMQYLRNDVQVGCKSKITIAGKDGTEAVKQAGAELDAFNAEGKWPDLPKLPQLRERAARAADAMRKAYAIALASYTQSGNDALESVIATDAERFEHQNDLVSWGANAIEKLSEAERTLNPSGKPLLVPGVSKGDFRLEVLAKRSGDKGDLLVDIPIAKGKRVAVPAVAPANGTVRVLLTVIGGGITADLGTSRPLAPGAALAAEDDAVSLRTEAGVFVVESVRLKPVIEGKPEPMTIVAKKDDDAAPRPKKPDAAKKNDEPKPDPVDPSAQLTAQSTWSGSWWNRANQRQHVTARVTMRDGQRVQLETANWWGDGKLIWTMGIRGRSLALAGLSYRGQHGHSFDISSSGGTIDGNKLMLSYKGTWSDGSHKNQPIEGRIELTKD